MEPLIRPERLDDHAAIHDLTKRAFAPMPYADGDEQDLIGKLRAAGALALSLVAECDGRIIGQVTFSPAFAADGATGWYTLGPVSVDPAVQRQGVGQDLIEHGLQILRERDAKGCILVGNPAYYSRFGFTLGPQHAPEGGHREFYQLLVLTGEVPDGVIGFHPLFDG